VTKDAFDALQKKSKGDGNRSSKMETSPKPGRKPQRNIDDSASQSSRGGTNYKVTSKIKKDANYWKALVLWEIIQRAHLQGNVEASVMDLTSIANILVRRYEIDDVNTAEHVLLAHAALIREMMEKKSLKNETAAKSATANGIASNVRWTKIPLYKALNPSKLSATALRNAQEIELKPRKIPLKDSSTEQSEDQVSTPVRTVDNSRGARRSRRSQKGQLSVPRHTSSEKFSKVSGKGKGGGKAPPPRRSKRHLAESEEEEEEEDDDDDEDSDMEMNVSTPTHGKRKVDTMNTDENPRPNKRFQTRMPIRTRGVQQQSPPATKEAHSTEEEEEEDVKDDEGEAESSSEDLEGAEQNEMVEVNLPLRLTSRTKTNASTSPQLTQTLQIRPLQSIEPNEPGDVWRCTVDGCIIRVYRAREEANKDLIRTHLQRHEDEGGQHGLNGTGEEDDDAWKDGMDQKELDRIETVFSEGRGTRLPVGYAHQLFAHCNLLPFLLLTGRPVTLLRGFERWRGLSRAC
jgi:hypothetical protein